MIKLLLDFFEENEEDEEEVEKEDDNNNFCTRSYDPEIYSSLLGILYAMGGLGGVLCVIQHFQHHDYKSIQEKQEKINRKQFEDDLSFAFSKIKSRSRYISDSLNSLNRIIHFQDLYQRKFGENEIELSDSDFGIFMIYKEQIDVSIGEIKRNTNIAINLIAMNPKWCFTYEAQNTKEELCRIVEMANELLSDLSSLRPNEFYKLIDDICSRVKNLEVSRYENDY